MDIAINYISNHDKNENGRYLSGVNTASVPDFAYQGMSRVKEQYRKTDGVLAYHLIQSFRPGEVTPETAHQIGVEYAKKVFGDKYEVLVSTHTDTPHFHNHLIVNSVSFLTGEKYHDGGKKNLEYLRSVSDELCKEHNLSVIEKPQSSKHVAYNVKQNEKQGKQTVRDMIREDIDEAIKYARNLPTFFSTLQKMDYEVSTTGKYLKVRPFGHERFFRAYNLGKDYTEEAIMQRIQDRNKPKLPAPYRSTNKRYSPQEKRRRALYAYTKRHSGFWSDILRTYLYYGNILKRVQKKTYPQRPPLYLREDLQKLQAFSDQMNTLAKYKIHTMPELSEQKEILNQEIGNLNKERNQIRRKLRTVTDETTIRILRSEITRVSVQIKPKYKDVKLLEEVEKRADLTARKAEKVALGIAPIKTLNKEILSK